MCVSSNDVNKLLNCLLISQYHRLSSIELFQQQKRPGCDMCFNSGNEDENLMTRWKIDV